MTPPEDDNGVTQDIHSPAPDALRERYELLGELGRGGMGVVYKARDKETGGVVALKVLQAEIAARPDVIERFKSELLLARKITHKNVCRTYELLRFGDTVVISMEYVEGESLRAVLKRFGSAPLRRGLEWAAQICSALAEAHGQGVVHRDLKPENILIARDGAAKVMDFGIARSLEPQATATATVIGTPAYMSPEQAEGKPVDHRTDIYALGLVLYEMFTGRPAFQADTPIGMLTARLQETPPPPSSVEPDLPDRIDRAIQKCLERKPEKRFQSVTDLEAALTRKTAARPVAGEAGGVPLPVHLTRWQRSD
ncbi:MAG: serine/threonine protein kinase, partial [Acidobacteria bacterium]|nr:serine/threonine protein kinase [Acidobacteriota bacterium]